MHLTGAEAHGAMLMTSPSLPDCQETLSALPGFSSHILELLPWWDLYSSFHHGRRLGRAIIEL